MKTMLFIGLFTMCSVAVGQVRSANDSPASISISTTPVGADVYVDSVFVGKSPVRNISTVTGRHFIRAFYPSVFSWNPLVVVDSLEALEGANPEKQIVLGTHLRVQSEPTGSTVLVGGTIAGTTPLYLQSPELLRENLSIIKLGYDTLVVPVGDQSAGYLFAKLNPKAGFPRGTITGVAPAAPTSDQWLTYASGATMIGSGVLSAYLKDRANREFDRYMITKDPGSLSLTRRLDKGAAASLVVSQISFVILAYILLSE
jgi:hypothetical protein